MTDLHNAPMTSRFPGSKSTVQPNKVRNPTGYVHERKPRDARKQGAKPGKGGKVKAWGLKARCGDDPDDWYSKGHSSLQKIRVEK